MGVIVNILVVTGMPASGKGEAVEFFREKDFRVVSLGDAVRDEAAEQGMEPSAYNLAELASSYRKRFGEGIWAKRIMSRITMSSNDRIVIDGMRGPAELMEIDKAPGNSIHLIAIHSSPITRRNRIIKRSRCDDSTDIEVFLARDERELGYGLGELISLAEFMVVNESSQEDLREGLEKVYGRLLEMWSNSNERG